MAAPIIPLLTALAQFAPTILRFIGVGEGSAKVADKVADVAMSVSGAKTLDEAVTAFASSTEKAYEFKIRMLALDKELEMLYLEDMQSARARDAEFIKTGQTNVRANTMFVMALAVVVGILWVVWADQEISEFVKGVITLMLGRFLGYLDTIYSFEFGTTRSSKEKDDTISRLSGK